MIALIVASLAFLQEAAGHQEMTAGGWVFMICAWVFILALTYFTFRRILGNRG